MAGDIMLKFQKILNKLGPPVDPQRDPKISIALRPYLCFMRDEIALANKAFILVRRTALKKLIENDYNRYMKELRRYDAGITRTQPYQVTDSLAVFLSLLAVSLK